jgi:hypothetical protein
MMNYASDADEVRGFGQALVVYRFGRTRRKIKLQVA